MDGAAWLAVSQIALGVICYLSLRHKASAANVARMESEIETLRKDLKALEKDHIGCQQERRRLVDASILKDEENAKLRLEIAAKEAEAKLLLKAELTQANRKLDENTDLTRQNAEKLNTIAENLGGRK